MVERKNYRRSGWDWCRKIGVSPITCFALLRTKITVISDLDRYPLYQLLILYLLPLLHPTTDEESKTAESPQLKSEIVEDVYHVLFTSHHLVSPTKRRNLQRWSLEYHLDGFAKVGYPGVIYAQGSKDDIEDFVENVKAMQWKALKVRFVEPLESLSEGDASSGREFLSGWNEYEKVGQVVEVMRRIARGKYVIEMGIGGGNE